MEGFQYIDTLTVTTYLNVADCYDFIMMNKLLRDADFQISTKMCKMQLRAVLLNPYRT